MAVADTIARVVLGDVKVPPEIEERMDRGRRRMRDDAPLRRVCFKFWRNEQYYYVQDNRAMSENTVTRVDGTGKPRWVSRTARNMIVDVVAHEVAASTQRVPNYEVNPSTADADDISAARLAAKVARYGYDKWDIRRITAKVVTNAVVADEGFAWPYWDSTVAPFIDDGMGGQVGQGEIRIKTFTSNEVYWEPGISFDESRWHAVEQARTPESIMEMENYQGGKLQPDATTEDERDDPSQAKLVMVTEYLERPSPRYPSGRWLTIANQKQIVPERPFPCQDNQGNVVDEPVIHKLSYFTDPAADRDMGLVRHLLDAQRTINECVNQQILWQRLALNPQIVIQNGEFKQRVTTEPGAVYHAVGTGEIKWRDVPNIPGELQQLKEDAQADLNFISGNNGVPSGVTSQAGISASLDYDASRRSDFLQSLAEFHSRLMRHCLYLVQKHYTEPRLVQVRGIDGVELIQDFLGANLQGQSDVTVMPGTLEPRTRSQMEARIMNYAQLGWINPEDAMYAIEAGTTEGLTRRIERDIERAHLIVEKLRAGPEALFNVPLRQAFPQEQQQLDPMSGQMVPVIDPNTGQPITEVPGWMPRPFDNIKVEKSVVEDFMKSVDYDNLDPGVQAATNQYYTALLQIEAQQAAREQAMQSAMAQDLGMANAAQPQAKPMPSLPALQNADGTNGNSAPGGPGSYT